MKFCPKCGQRLTGFDLEEKQRYIHQPEAPLKEKNWFERHLNWTMVFGVLGATLVNVVVQLGIISYDPYVSDDVLYVIGFVIALAILIPVLGWALRRKNRSLWWLPLGLFVPFGWIVLLCLDNRSRTSKLPELQG